MFRDKSLQTCLCSFNSLS